MSQYFQIVFKFIKLFVAGYVSYKNPNDQECADYFNQTLKDAIVTPNKLIQNENETKQDPLDESKDEECKDDNPELQCVICLNNKRKIVILPCKHSHTCISCVKKLDICPVCRGVIKFKLSYIT